MRLAIRAYGELPTTSFDCKVTDTMDVWEKLELTYSRTAINSNMIASKDIPLSEAQAGDLVFFHSTYNATSILLMLGYTFGNNRMFHAGDPIGYADLTSPHWQQHLAYGDFNQNNEKGRFNDEI